jgi:hypothetical protein
MSAMETRAVNIADLEEPYAELKTRQVRAEGRLLVSLQASGQKTPLFVIAGSAPGRYAVVDGHKRVRALKALKADVAQAHVWLLNAGEALARAYRMQQGSWNALEEAALVEELHRDAKWSLRKIGEVLEAVGHGKIGVYCAVKYLLPLARAKVQVAERLALKLSEGHFPTRQVRVLYEHCIKGSKDMTERIVNDPATFLKALEASQAIMDLALSSAQNKHLERLRVMGNVCLGLVRDLPEHWSGPVAENSKLAAVWPRCRDCFGMLEKTVSDLIRVPAHD